MHDISSSMFDAMDVAQISSSNHYDSIQFINLDRSADRLINMENQLNNTHLNYSRFPAIDGYNIKITSMSNYDVLLGKDLNNHNSKIEFKLYHKYLVDCYPDLPDLSIKPANFIYTPIPNLHPHATPGELGCTCSHRRIWSDILAKEKGSTLVLEDDVVLKQNFEDKFLASLKNTPLDYDIIYFYVNAQDQSDDPKNFGLVDKFTGNTWGTAAMSISLKGADHLLNITNPMQLGQIDLQINKMREQLIIYKSRHFPLEHTAIFSESVISLMGRDDWPPK